MSRLTSQEWAAAARATLACLFFAAGARAQIFTADAGVASPELPSVRALLTTLHTSVLDEARLAIDLGYSPRTDLELRLRLPLVWRDLDFVDPAAANRASGSLLGLGDVELRAKYALLRDDDVMRSNRVSLLADVTFPTGSHDASLHGVLLPRRLQLGLGSFGFGIGPAFTLVRDRHRASLELGYRQWTTDDGFAPGGTVYGNAAYWFRLSPARFERDVEQTEYRLVGEVLTAHRFDDQQDGLRLCSGGTEVWGVLGLQINLTPSRRLEIGARVPLLDTMDDALGTRRFATVLSFKVYF